MGTATLRPDGTTASSFVLGGGAGSAHAATNDDADATYLQPINTLSLSTAAQLTLGTTALPAGSQVRSLTARIRHRKYSSDGARMTRVLLRQPGIGDPGGVAEVNGTAGAIVTSSGPPAVTQANGALWDQAAIDALTLYVEQWLQSSGTPNRIYELYVDVVYNEVPVVTVTGPAEGSTITDDSQPAVTWTYSDPEGDPQERVRVKVFSAAQYGAGGFDPETSTATWDSGELFSSGTSVEVGVPLLNATYRAYVKAADAGSSGRYSAWDYDQFTINSTPPPDPTIAATVQAAQGRTKVDVTAAAGAPSTEFVTVEYSDDVGGSWATLRGATKLSLAPSATLSVYDYEAPPGESRRYRAKAGRFV